MVLELRLFETISHGNLPIVVPIVFSFLIKKYDDEKEDDKDTYI